MKKTKRIRLFYGVVSIPTLCIHRRKADKNGVSADYYISLLPFLLCVEYYSSAFATNYTHKRTNTESVTEWMNVRRLIGIRNYPVIRQMDFAWAPIFQWTIINWNRRKSMGSEWIHWILMHAISNYKPISEIINRIWWLSTKYGFVRMNQCECGMVELWIALADNFSVILCSVKKVSVCQKENIIVLIPSKTIEQLQCGRTRKKTYLFTLISSYRPGSIGKNVCHWNDWMGAAA